MEGIEEAHTRQDIFDYLTEFGGLDETEIGIIKRALDKGVDSLSPKQKYRYDNAFGKYLHLECKRCGQEIPECEVVGALLEKEDARGTYCSWCLKMMSNND